MLYRLDYLTDDGRIDCAVRTIGTDYLSSKLANARAYGIAAARQSGRQVLLTKINNAGRLVPTLRITPENTTHKVKIERSGNVVHYT